MTSWKPGRGDAWKVTVAYISGKASSVQVCRTCLYKRSAWVVASPKCCAAAEPYQPNACARQPILGPRRSSYVPCLESACRYLLVAQIHSPLTESEPGQNTFCAQEEQPLSSCPRNVRRLLLRRPRLTAASPSWNTELDCKFDLYEILTP